MAFNPIRDALVHQLSVGLHVGREEAVVAQAAVGVNVQRAGQGRALLAFPQRAKIIRQLLGQHGHVLARQVHGKCTDAGFQVSSVALFHISGGVGNRHAQLPAAFGTGHHM